MNELSLARTLDYPEYPEFRCDDRSTHVRLIIDARKYLAQHNCASKYYFWCPEFGCCYIGN